MTGGKGTRRRHRSPSLRAPMPTSNPLTGSSRRLVSRTDAKCSTVFGHFCRRRWSKAPQPGIWASQAMTVSASTLRTSRRTRSGAVVMPKRICVANSSSRARREATIVSPLYCCCAMPSLPRTQMFKAHLMIGPRLIAPSRTRSTTSTGSSPSLPARSARVVSRLYSISKMRPTARTFARLSGLRIEEVTAVGATARALVAAPVAAAPVMEACAAAVDVPVVASA
mmetsp:Transcript_17646/g.45292  ORF Transcript_17646/g.45292 Transcript_17646/m.45292 type:complete len:225 (+) Transcript_17646:456-1130(+)